ncbi:MAG: hypothetical protein JJD96_02315 [Thermoleophilia bacterium]|nr:hypothetical protein [Thermoleophilia bacterium]
MRDRFGRELGAVIIARDITERRRAGQALRESESGLKAIMESVPTGITIIEPATHTIVEVNTSVAILISKLFLVRP